MTTVESGTSQSKSGTSVHSSNIRNSSPRGPASYGYINRYLHSYIMLSGVAQGNPIWLDKIEPHKHFCLPATLASNNSVRNACVYNRTFTQRLRVKPEIQTKARASLRCIYVKILLIYLHMFLRGAGQPNLAGQDRTTQARLPSDDARLLLFPDHAPGFRGWKTEYGRGGDVRVE